MIDIVRTIPYGSQAAIEAAIETCNEVDAEAMKRHGRIQAQVNTMIAEQMETLASYDVTHVFAVPWLCNFSEIIGKLKTKP